MIRSRTFINWSGGKDACLALYYSMQNPRLEISSLLTTVSLPYQRITMHGVARALLEKQSKVLRIPLKVLELGESVNMDTYDGLMRSTLDSLYRQGYRKSVFGDIFLTDLKEYREQQFEGTGIQPEFPLWEKDSRSLITEFIKLGFKAKIVCANARLMDKSFLGRTIDLRLIDELPTGVDPCGENGEFHTFVYDGPIFNQAIDLKVGHIVRRKYNSENTHWDTEFWFCELMESQIP